ncbi:MAG TPA: hypothetical protein VKE41_16875 [Roseiflexaceae bacterium]|nr:hypothetical protein [Roseiflexaceae bacterium]
MQRDELFYGLRRAWFELLPRDAEIAAYNEQFNRLIYGQILVAMQKLAARGLTWPGLDLESTSWLITMLFDQAWQREPGPREATEQDIQRQRDAMADLIYHAVIRGP